MSADHLLHESIQGWWINIDSEVLLLTFLPGLVYKDASSLNVHLLQMALSQCLLFAFPMVLAGTTLTALTFKYIFPYDWSFNLCMTAGSILSATDPVAVSALLEAVGAPPRLKVHIAGESLLNDGSAIVFFTIFGLNLYLSELEVDGFGEEMGWAQGVKTFFRMSLGAVAIGAFFAIGTLQLSSLLTRRLSREENVVEVAMEITMAYLCYFVAEIAWGTSGVIATVTMGILTNAFGKALVNDRHLRNDFLALVEHMLNTVLFALGGLVWGSVIANSDEEYPERQFSGEDWGYLLLLYVILAVIRFGLFLVFYPLTSRIGLKSSLPEMIFQSYGGLRGAVGIALAISLDNLVRKSNAEDSKFILQTNKLFGFVGGIAFMTLMINATTAGPLIRKLGLADTTAIREGMLKAFKRNWKMAVLDDMIRYISTQVRYSRVSFEVVKHHVPLLAGVTTADFIEAANNFKEQNKDNENYSERDFQRMLDQFQGKESVPSDPSSELDDESSLGEVVTMLPAVHHHQEKFSLRGRRRLSSRSLARSQLSLMELRRVFIELVRGDYERQIQHGELTDREFVAFSLFQSLDWCTDQVQRGEKLQDWENSLKFENNVVIWLRIVSFAQWLYSMLECVLGRRRHVTAEYFLTRVRVERALAFIHAHNTAQAYFRREYANDSQFSRCGQVILDESMEQVAAAEAHLLTHKNADIEVVISHKFCSILLLNAARYVERVAASGLLKPIEAEEALEEVQEALHEVDSCSIRHHADETVRYDQIIKKESMRHLETLNTAKEYDMEETLSTVKEDDM
jgi:NhaP-type Na+/H+ or K+/H+ antiporter